ncbi:MAG: nitrous oxide reductase family maturation protein NosD [Candidatus Hodarchaeota archaeon]
MNKGINVVIMIFVFNLFIGSIVPNLSTRVEDTGWQRLTNNIIRDNVFNECISAVSDSVHVTYGKLREDFGFNIYYLYCNEYQIWSEEKIVESHFPCFRPTIAAKELLNGSLKIAVVFDNENEILCSVIYNSDDEWKIPVNVSCSNEQDWHPTIVMDENGIIHCAWITKFADPEQYKIVYAREIGNSWSIEVINESELGGYGWGANPDIILVDGLPHIFYRGGNYETYKIHHSYKESIEGLWLTEVLSTGNNEDLLVSAKVDDIGDIHLAVSGYDGWDPEYPRRVYYLRRDYTSKEWEETLLISENAGNGKIGISDDNSIFIFYLGQWGNGFTGDIYLATQKETGFDIVEIPTYPIAIELLNPSVDYWPDKGEVLLMQATIGDYNPRYYEIVFYGSLNSNAPPSTPTIIGPKYGKVGVDYTYCISNDVDPDGDNLYCLFDWGDGSDSGWLGPFNSEEEICANHTWSSWGFHEVKAKLCDEYGAESDWGKLIVFVPKNQCSYTSSVILPHFFIHIDGNEDFTNIFGRPNWLKGVVDGKGTIDNPYIISNWWILPRLSFGNKPLIHIENTDAHVVIKNCIIIGLHFRNIIWNNGIYLHNTSNISIKNCKISNCYDGIWIHNSTYNYVGNTFFKNNRCGIYIRRSSNNNVVKCEFKNCPLSGVTISWGNDPYNEYEHIPSSFNTIENCIFHGSYYKEDYGAGVYLCCLANSTDNKIQNCDFFNNRYGIWFHNWIFNTTVTNCNIKENDCGFLVSIGENNSIYHNSFIDNDIQAYDSNINYWYNKDIKEGNYWNDYTGEDNNGDGIGDIPYYIPGGNNYDLYPLMNDL